MEDSMAHRIPVYSVRLVRERSEPSEVKRVTCPEAVFGFLQSFLAEADREQLGVLILDTKMNIRGVNIVTVGLLDESLVHPREVFKPAILGSAYGIILFHNHPSGDPTPSMSDILTTKRLWECGELLNIPLLDHIVVGHDRCYSFAAKGVGPFGAL